MPTIDIRRTDLERLSVLETRMTDLTDDIKDIKTTVNTINTTLQSVLPLQDRVSKLEAQSNLWRFLSPTFAAVLGSLLTFLIISFLNK